MIPTFAGGAAFLLHHPRKKAAEAGSSARGSGALLGFADVTVELTRFGRLKSDSHRRLALAGHIALAVLTAAVVVLAVFVFITKPFK